MNIDSALPQVEIKKVDEWRSAIYEGKTVSIRRLSTKSSVLSNDDNAVGMTEWKWYWNNNNIWDEYAICVSRFWVLFFFSNKYHQFSFYAFKICCPQKLIYKC